MDNILESGSIKLNVTTEIVIGNKKNRLALNRKFLKVEFNDNLFYIENLWDLLVTQTVRDVKQFKSYYESHIFSKTKDSIAVFYNMKCVIANRQFGDYLLCIIWNIENDEVEILCRTKVDGVYTVMATEFVIDKYGPSILYCNQE